MFIAIRTHVIAAVAAEVSDVHTGNAASESRPDENRAAGIEIPENASVPSGFGTKQTLRGGAEGVRF